MERLRNHREFVAALRHRRRVTSHDIVIHYRLRNHEGESQQSMETRMGLAVSKAVGNAVTRNTVKRRFRILAQRYEQELPQQCDIVMRAKPSAAHASFSELEKQVATLFRAVKRKTEQI